MKTLVIGAAILDVMMKIDKLPEKGEDVLSNNSKLTVGGCAYNVACTLDNLGDDFDLLVPIGTGPIASFIEKGLRTRDFNTLIHEEGMDNGYCITIIEKDGERTFITNRGLEGDFKKEWLNKLNLDKYDVVYIAGYEVLGEVGKIISDFFLDKGKLIFFAPGPLIKDIDEYTIDNFIRMKSIFHMNEKESKAFTGKNDAKEAIKQIHNLTGSPVFVSMGDKGCMYMEDKNIELVKSKSIEVVDTVGAGDSHAASLIYGLKNGFDIEDSVKLANKVAGLIVKTQGPTVEKHDFNEYMEEDQYAKN